VLKLNIFNDSLQALAGARRLLTHQVRPVVALSVHVYREYTDTVMPLIDELWALLGHYVFRVPGWSREPLGRDQLRRLASESGGEVCAPLVIVAHVATVQFDNVNERRPNAGLAKTSLPSSCVIGESLQQRRNRCEGKRGPESYYL